MRLLLIIIKEIKQNARNLKANSMMILFPIILIVILGASFSGQFTASDLALSDVKVLYHIEEDTELGKSFRAFLPQLHQELGISFEETSDPAAGISSIQDVKYSAFLLLETNPEGIKIYKNGRYWTEAKLVESLIQSFAGRYSAIAQIAKSNPAVLAQVLNDQQMTFVEVQSLNRQEQAGSLDYYAVAMLTLFLMYGSLTGLYSVKTEKNLKTMGRVLNSPVSKLELLAGKTLGGILVTLVQAAIIIVFSILVLKANWGSDILGIVPVIAAAAVMAISLGIGIAYLIRSDGAAAGLINIVIPVIAFLGGSYIPLSVMGSLLFTIGSLSPLKWTNDAIFRVIYNGDYSAVLPAVLINLGIAAAFLITAAVFSRKETA